MTALTDRIFSLRRHVTSVQEIASIVGLTVSEVIARLRDPSLADPPVGTGLLGGGGGTGAIVTAWNGNDGEMIPNSNDGDGNITAWAQKAAYGDPDAFEVTPEGVIVANTGVYMASLEVSPDTVGESEFGVTPTGALFRNNVGTTWRPPPFINALRYGTLYVEAGAVIGAHVINNDVAQVMYTTLTLARL